MAICEYLTIAIYFVHVRKCTDDCLLTSLNVFGSIQPEHPEGDSHIFLDVKSPPLLNTRVKFHQHKLVGII